MTTSPALDVDAALNDVLDDLDTNTPTAQDQQPYVAALPAAALFADHAYQRDLDDRRVDNMAATFNLALVGILEVSDRGQDRYAILDGQHRWAMMKAITPNANPALVCRIHTGLRPAEEARLYHRLNTTRRQLTGWDRWVARRGAGDQLVLDIEAAANRAGLTIGAGVGANILRATRACERIVEWGEVALLDDTLSTVRAIWPSDQSGLDAALILGLAHVLRVYPDTELDRPRLVDALAGVMPRQVTARAVALREIQKGTNDRLTAHVIVEQYNRGKGRSVEPFLTRVVPLTQAEGKRVRENQTIRDWATQQGIDLPPKALPRRVRELYKAAHPS